MLGIWQLECGRVFNCLCLFLCMGVRQCIYKEKERFRSRAVQMDSLKGLLGIRRMDRVPNG